MYDISEITMAQTSVKYNLLYIAINKICLSDYPEEWDL